jgi:hypothetical protein
LPTLFSISSLTRGAGTSTVATATVPLGTAGLVPGELVGITGANQNGFNGAVFITGVGPTSFTYTVSNTLTSPDTGSPITAAVIGVQPLPSLHFITSAKATFTTASLAAINLPQNHALRVVYNGDNTAPFPLPQSFPFRGEWANGVSGVYGLQVTKDNTTGVVSANPTNNSPFGSAVTFVDTVTSTFGGSVHGGTVVFKDGTTALGPPVSVDLHGHAVLIISSLNVPGNPHSITAVYSGNGNLNGDTSPALSYTIVPGATTTTITGPITAATTSTLAVSTLTQSGGIATATFPAGTTFTSNVITIAGATPAGYNGVFDVTLGTNSFTYQVDPALAATATGTTITATMFVATPITINQAFNLTAHVAGAPGFTPTGTLVFVAESNFRDATTGSTPSFTPFTLGTATLAGGIATLAMPASGPTSLGAEAIAAGNASPADVFELEAFYNGDPNYTAGHSTTIAAHGGPRAAGAGELAIRDTGVAFQNAFGLGSGNVVTTISSKNGLQVIGKVRPSVEIGTPPPTTVTVTSATGGFAGHLKVFLDGTQFKTASGGNSTLQINSTSGTFNLTRLGVAPPGMHTVVIQYMGDNVDGFLPAGNTTIIFNQPLAASHNALASPKGSVAFSTAPKSTNGTVANSTSSATQSSSTGGLSNHGVDDYFASTTTHQTPRTLAGALAKAHSGDDWLSGPF